MTEVFDAQSIEAYVPHRGAMLLLDRLLSADANHAVAEACIRGDSLFVHDGVVPAWVGLEYMAQTIAAWAGGRAMQAGTPVKLGFLLGSRRYEAFRPHFPCGATLRIRVANELIGDNGLGLFDCQIWMNDELVAKATVSVFEPADCAAFLANEMKSNTHD